MKLVMLSSIARLRAGIHEKAGACFQGQSDEIAADAVYELLREVIHETCVREEGDNLTYCLLSSRTSN
jgi:hypothetical protein